MKLIFAFAIFLLAAGCTKIYDGEPGVGGQLPSNFIAVKDSSFFPVILSVVNGSTITFVNNTATDKQIQSTDSVIIPRVTIPAGGFYKFTKDTTASFQYYRVDKPAVVGQINLTQ